MIGLILGKIFGTKHERDVKRMRPAVAAINALEPALQELSDTELRGKTEEFRQRVADGEEVEALLPEAFAACREAARRTVQMRHFDVQLMGGMVVHEGKIAEMATGEGKTLVATLSAYLNALPGLGTHVVTVNDYLARRDAQWMGPISEEHTSELQSRLHIVCRLLLEKKKRNTILKMISDIVDACDHYHNENVRT